MISDNLPAFPPYSQHFRCMQTIIRSGATFKVFQFLFDEYLKKKRSGENTYIKINNSSLAAWAGVDRETIGSHLQSLEKMQLIKTGSVITVNADNVFSIAIAFNKLVDTKAKQDFIKAFKTGDYTTLKELGYERVNASVVHNLLTSSIMTKNPQDYVNDEKSAKKDDFSSGDDFSAKIDEKSSKIDEKSAISENIVGFYAAIIRQIFNKRRFFRMIKEIYDEKSAEIELEELTDCIFDEKSAILKKFWGKYSHILILLICLEGDEKSSIEVTKNPQKGDEKSSTVNKEEINLINKVPQILKKIFKGKEIFENEDEQGTSSFENFEESQEHDDKLPELDLNILAERNTQQYKKIKRKQNLPFLPEEDVKRWASNIRECLDRPDKLFLHYLYGIGHELFDKEEETDEEGNIISEASSSIDKWLCYEDRVVPDLLTPAMDSLMEAVKAGKVIVDGEELPVEIKEKDVDPSLVELLIDWDKVSSSLNQGSYLYIITPDKYKNIYAEEVPVVKKERNFEERKKKIDDNNTYLHKLILLAQWNDTYEQLTCLEKTVFNFADTFFQLDDNTLKPVDILKQSEMSQFRHTALKASLQRFKLTKLIGPLTWEDFTSIFYGTKIDMNECLYLETRMFDADLIRRYNALHNLHSIVDEQSLDELIEDYTGGNETSSQ